MRKGVYHAEYLVADWDDAVSLTKQLYAGFLSSFGDDDEQWEGLYVEDPGAAISLGNHKWGVLVSVTVPVEQVPRRFWLSPYVSDSVLTYKENGKDARGEAYDWGMRFPRKEK